jgi:hypothetical protein
MSEHLSRSGFGMPLVLSLDIMSRSRCSGERGRKRDFQPSHTVCECQAELGWPDVREQARLLKCSLSSPRSGLFRPRASGPASSWWVTRVCSHRARAARGRGKGASGQGNGSQRGESMPAPQDMTGTSSARGTTDRRRRLVSIEHLETPADFSHFIPAPSCCTCPQFIGTHPLRHFHQMCVPASKADATLASPCNLRG